MTTHTYPVVGVPTLPHATAPQAHPGEVGWPTAAPPPPVQPPRGPRRTGLWILAATATVCSLAALTLGVVALNKASQNNNTAAAATPTPAMPSASSPATQVFDDVADKALCQALPSLMRERNSADKAYQALAGGSPERNAAIPEYKAGVQDWAQRMETVLAAHAQPDRYLTRTLQRYIDDKMLYAQNIYHDEKADPYDKTTWDLGIVDYGGALGRCQQLGIRW